MTPNKTNNSRNDLDNKQAKWFAFYVAPQCEKTVHKRLLSLGLESYCPVKKEIKQWSDREKVIESPIFRSYAFARILREDYYSKIKFIDQIIKIVDIGGEVICIKDEEIEWIKLLEGSNFIYDTISNEEICKGDQMRIRSGGMKGVVGNITYQSGKTKFGLELSFMNRTILVEIDLQQLEKV